jgi:hypothetical protein
MTGTLRVLYAFLVIVIRVLIPRYVPEVDGSGRGLTDVLLRTAEDDTPRTAGVSAEIRKEHHPNATPESCNSLANVDGRKYTADK